MSSTLYWYPPRKDGETLPDALKFLVRDRFGYPTDMIVDYSNVAYFMGLQDARVEGAKEVVDRVDELGSVLLREVF